MEDKYWANARDTGYATLEIFVLDDCSGQVFCDFVPSLSLDDADELLTSAGYERSGAWKSGVAGHWWSEARKSGILTSMPMELFDYTRSPWSVAAKYHLGQALDAVVSGLDALASVSAAQACLEMEAGEIPKDYSLIDDHRVWEDAPVMRI